MSKNMDSRVKLINGVEMPIFGLGVYMSDPGEETYNAVRYALDVGYRLFDTASFYNNEKDVGKAIKESGVPREDCFVTTKLWINDFPNREDALNKSLKELGFDYIDLYLLHWPGIDTELRLKTWEFLIDQMNKGKLRSIGGANLEIWHIEELKEKSGVYPMNCQDEIHPWHQQRELRIYCGEHDIAVTSWGPMMRGHAREEPVLFKIGEKYNKSPEQVVLRWHVQNNINIIPKSVHKERILANSQIFDFELSEEDMKLINDLDGKHSFGFDPDKFDGDIDKFRKQREMDEKKKGVPWAK